MEISRDGHRARMRAAYLQGGGDAMPDHQLLELLLSISIPRKDVKPIAYALINRFGSLEQVFAAGAADLQQVPGVGEQTAVQILLVRDLNRRDPSKSKQTGQASYGCPPSPAPTLPICYGTKPPSRCTWSPWTAVPKSCKPTP